MMLPGMRNRTSCQGVAAGGACHFRTITPGQHVAESRALELGCAQDVTFFEEKEARLETWNWEDKV